MDSVSPSNSARSLNLVQLLLSDPEYNRKTKRNGKGIGSSPDEMTFEERMAEAKALMETKSAIGGSAAPGQSQAVDPEQQGQSGDVASEIAGMTTDEIMAYSAQMIQQGRSGATRVTAISVDIDITEVTIVQGQGEAQQQQPQTCDPLVLDLNRDGKISTSSAQSGVSFDINGDGAAERTAFVSDGDGVLAYDRDGDGVISSGLELFGDQHGSANGFLELEKFDENGDGVINSSDSIFSKLSVATRAADGSLVTKGLAQYGIAELGLQNSSTYISTGGGSYISETGEARDSEGRSMLLADANFAYVA